MNMFELDSDAYGRAVASEGLFGKTIYLSI
jgi:hypothetical protein